VQQTKSTVQYVQFEFAVRHKYCNTGHGFWQTDVAVMCQCVLQVMQTENMLYLVSEYAPHGEIFGLYPDLFITFVSVTFDSGSCFSRSWLTTLDVDRYFPAADHRYGRACKTTQQQLWTTLADQLAGRWITGRYSGKIKFWSRPRNETFPGN